MLFLLCLALPVFAQEADMRFRPAVHAFSPQAETAVGVVPGRDAVADEKDPRRISLDIKGMDIVDLMKMISVRAGVNIVVGKNVGGQVSMFLRDVDIWDAFEIILQANDLAYHKEANGIVNIMSQKDYQDRYGVPYRENRDMAIVSLKHVQAKDLLQTVSQIKSANGSVVVDDVSNSLIIMDASEPIRRMRTVIEAADVPVATRVYELNYADAAVMEGAVESMLSDGVGKMQIDERTGKIAVTDTIQRLNAIETVIRAFDARPQQVLIDAQIIELRPSKQFAMGIDWDYFFKEKYRVSMPFDLLLSETPLSIGTFEWKTDSDGNQYLGAGYQRDERLDGGKSPYSFVVNALKSLGDTKILSSPRVIAIDGEEARIHVGQKKPYLTSTVTAIGDSSSTTETPQFIEVGVKLLVTPTISRDGFITMRIKPEVSSAEYTNLGTDTTPKRYPITTASEAETVVTIKDGTTIIMGGLRQDIKDKRTRSIPILGKIPGVSWLFSNVQESTTVSDLIILLTPHIVTGEAAITDFTQVKPHDGVRLSMDNGDLTRESSPGKSEDIVYRRENW
jgi:type II secretory pathway component GspD/PulD (secretin)